MLKSTINSIEENLQAQKNPFPFWQIEKARNSALTVRENSVLLHSAYNPEREALQTSQAFDGKDFDAALKEAQEKGYAEKNPAADIEGHDTARKIAILASLISGRKISYEQVDCEGITGITSEDFLNAEAYGMSIKLLGVYDAENNTVIVAPHLIKNDNALYNINGVFNGVMIKGNMVDELLFYGRGAGKLPTASAVISDVIECVKNQGRNIDNGFADLEPGSVNKVPEKEHGQKFRFLS